MTTARASALLMLAAFTAAGASAQTPAAPATAPPQRATFAPCPSPPPRFGTIAVDSAVPVAVRTTQQFVVALRAVRDGGYGWRLASGNETGTVVRADGMQILSDITFVNLDRPGQPPMTGGAATELWLFTALAPGTATLTFSLTAPGASVPLRTSTFTVRVSPSVLVC